MAWSPESKDDVGPLAVKPHSFTGTSPVMVCGAEASAAKIMPKLDMVGSSPLNENGPATVPLRERLPGR